MPARKHHIFSTYRIGRFVQGYFSRTSLQLASMTLRWVQYEIAREYRLMSYEGSG